MVKDSKHESPEHLRKVVSEARKKVKIWGLYRHYKGHLYLVKGIALHSETLEPLVLYEPQYITGVKFWVRPLKMWNENVEFEGKRVPRFQLIKN